MNSTTNLYETTKQELEAIGALDGPKEPQDAQNSKMGTSQSMCAGTFSTTWSQNKKKIKINMTPSKPMPFTRYHFFKKMPQLPLDRPCIRIGSKYEGSADEIYRKEQRKAKEFRVSSQNFRTIGGGAALVN